MDKKRLYHKPVLRKVRLEVKTSVLAKCHTSTLLTPSDDPGPFGCHVNECFTTTP